MTPEGRRRYGEVPPDRRTLAAMLWRGARRRCPRCGTRGVFDRWFVLRPTCPGCGLRFRREQGFGLGGTTFTVVFTCLTFGTLLLGVAAATAPEVPVLALLVACSVIAVLEPLATYPSWTLIWAAIDLAMRPLGFAELAAADIELLTGRADPDEPGAPERPAG